jgi:glycosyltransferase involved in cell wall biosynthesis
MNQSGRIQLEWIRGARGAEKQALFEQAQIFVLPTQYPVEAQPLAVLEAMAHGCAIVTTDVGELAFDGRRCICHRVIHTYS